MFQIEVRTFQAYSVYFDTYLLTRSARHGGTHAWRVWLPDRDHPRHPWGQMEGDGAPPADLRDPSLQRAAPAASARDAADAHAPAARAGTRRRDPQARLRRSAASRRVQPQ